MLRVIPAGFSPPVLAGVIPPSPSAARPANGLLPMPPICNNDSSCNANKNKSINRISITDVVHGVRSDN